MKFSLKNEQLHNLNLICKWGCDGLLQDEYRQKFIDLKLFDASVFIILFIILFYNLQLESNGYILGH